MYLYSEINRFLSSANSNQESIVDYLDEKHCKTLLNYTYFSEFDDEFRGKLKRNTTPTYFISIFGYSLTDFHMLPEKEQNDFFEMINRNSTLSNTDETNNDLFSFATHSQWLTFSRNLIYKISCFESDPKKQLLYLKHYLLTLLSKQPETISTFLNNDFCIHLSYINSLSDIRLLLTDDFYYFFSLLINQLSRVTDGFLNIDQKKLHSFLTISILSYKNKDKDVSEVGERIIDNLLSIFNIMRSLNEFSSKKIMQFISNIQDCIQPDALNNENKEKALQKYFAVCLSKYDQWDGFLFPELNCEMRLKIIRNIKNFELLFKGDITFSYFLALPNALKNHIVDNILRVIRLSNEGLFSIEMIALLYEKNPALCEILLTCSTETLRENHMRAVETITSECTTKSPLTTNSFFHSASDFTPQNHTINAIALQ